MPFMMDIPENKRNPSLAVKIIYIFYYKDIQIVILRTELLEIYINIWLNHT